MRSAYYTVVNLLKSLAAALQFLTRLPIPIDLFGAGTNESKGAEAKVRPTFDSDMDSIFSRSTVFFPVAGFIIGVIVAALAWGLDDLLPPYVNVMLLLCVWVFLSGGLHLDGLMDTADGLLSHRSQERMLEIMKDSRVGAMGVIVCVLYVMLKAALLYALLTDDGAGALGELERFMLLALIPVWSRAFMSTAITGWRYVRPGQGMGQLFRSVHKGHAAAACLMALLLSVLVFTLPFASSLDWLDVIFGCGFFIAVTYCVGTLIASLVARKLGGLTGDVYGALNELVELALLLGLVAVIRMI
jgi:adenosylcobinamide-GDP ribazoletransferase